MDVGSRFQKSNVYSKPSSSTYLERIMDDVRKDHEGTIIIER